MKLKIFKFIGGFYLFFLVMEVLRELLRSDKYLEQFEAYPLDFSWSVLQSSLLFLAYALFAYVFLFYRFKKQPKWATFIGIVVISLGVIGIRYIVEEVLIKAITGYGNYYEGTTALYYIVDNLYYAILYTAFGISWFFIHYSAVRDRQQQELLLENKKSELAFLKSQVNPHFLFNMLNNIYSLINMGSDKALPATEKLSKLLRYSLYETDQLVTIREELDAIHDYIGLQELRFRESVQTSITIANDVLELQVAPFLLLPLVENAFKHGVVIDPKAPIKITVERKNAALFIEVRNAIAVREKDGVGGIGVENLKKRLELTYGNDYSFQKTEADGFYTIQIILNLKP